MMMLPKTAIKLFTLLFILVNAIPLMAAADTKVETDKARFKTLMEYATISNAIYQENDHIKKTFLDYGYTLIVHDQLPGYGVSYALATNDDLKQQIIAIRGTANVENAIVDMAFILLDDEHTGIKLHQGFSKPSGDIYEKIKPLLNKNYRINTTGHSLGGAAALILAMMVDADNFNVGKAITFGQPKVTNISGSRKYSHLDVTRVVMPKDMVPLAPPFDPTDMMDLSIYWHIGTEVILYEDNTYSVLRGVESMMRATDFMTEAITEENLQHHFMSQYIKALSQKLVDPKTVPYESKFSISDYVWGK